MTHDSEANPPGETQDKPTLGYWDIRGFGANIRYQLAYCGLECGVDYNLKEYSDYDNWHKEAKPTKKSEGFDFPNLPYFIDGEIKLTETLAIHEYIAAKWRPELLGKNMGKNGNTSSDAASHARLTMLSMVLNDFRWKIIPPCYRTGDLDHFKQEVMKRLPNIVDFMGENSFLCGEEPTYHDFYFFEGLQLVACLTEGGIYEEFPSLKRYHENFKGLPGLKEYLETSPEKERTFTLAKGSGGVQLAKLNGTAGY